jgi:transcriptional regulator with XRE-family HTH domain
MADKKQLQIAVGKRIKKLREDRNISQQDIAGACNIEKSNFSRLEAGNTNPTLFTLQKIAENLDVDLSEIVNFTLPSNSKKRY